MNVVAAIRSGSSLAMEGLVIEDIRSLLIQVGCDSCTSVSCNGNRPVAHCLANLVCVNDAIFHGCTHSLRVISPYLLI